MGQETSDLERAPNPKSKIPVQRSFGGENPKSDRVAVIGAGPAGMAVADRLARLGYQVTVFEKLPVIGGMMAVGIPEYRLPRDVIGREYRQIQDLGVEVRLNTTIGPGGDSYPGRSVRDGLWGCLPGGWRAQEP